MFNTFSVLFPHLKLKNKAICIDNIAFKFHYRATFLVLLVCSILVTSRQYIGEHIRCITGGSIPEHVINTFCFFTTTFTVVRYFNESMLQENYIPHPGVGHMNDEEPVKHHAYYQWVPFILFLQAIMFYAPHYLWRSIEGGRIKMLVTGLKMVEISQYYHNYKNVVLENKYTLYSQLELTKKIASVRRAFQNHLRTNNIWAFEHIFCEMLNLVNALMQVWGTNLFLGGRFYSLGKQVMREDFSGTVDVLDTVFPKVTKCHFHKYGPSGTIQKHDALCIMALNVINEKIFTFLWFWYLILISISIVALVWRLIILYYHGRCDKFNAFIFSFSCPGSVNSRDVTVITRLPFSAWFFLYYLSSNMDRHMFKAMFKKISNNDCRNYDTDEVFNKNDVSSRVLESEIFSTDEFTINKD
ncbi:innexin inx7 isoform X2 [Toxorhynchites rutilus septentrionalis]|uniref:innexin inx7 isoform X2 n=1 Tax=Toxorhynchites rutilus septentrionalis TaxID=329112 RepID=UPI0024799C96|nr:innexin inx7 isoform X2 [Toxorhynchites rutilus septentrionalis]